MKRIVLAAMILIVRPPWLEAALAEPVTFTATLRADPEGQQEASPASGTATVVVDPAAHSLKMSLSFAGLRSTTVAAHIHCLCTEPPGTQVTSAATQVPTFPGFPQNVTNGTFSGSLDTSAAGSFSPRFLAASGGTVTGAEAALFAGMLAGKAYLNIHTHGTERLGEIRGFLQRAP